MTTVDEKPTQPTLMAGNRDDRIAGLDRLLEVAPGTTVLDCGCHMGYIAAEFARAGARVIHAFDRFEPGVDATRALLDEFPIEKKVEVLDLLKRGPGSLRMLQRYDIVLYLGMHHKMLQQAKERAGEILSEMLGRSDQYFAIRTPSNNYAAIEPVIAAEGFSLLSSRPQATVGELRIYQRSAQAHV
jgi:hypothetical protein